MPPKLSNFIKNIKKREPVLFGAIETWFNFNIKALIITPYGFDYVITNRNLVETYGLSINLPLAIRIDTKHSASTHRLHYPLFMEARYFRALYIYIK